MIGRAATAHGLRPCWGGCGRGRPLLQWLSGGENRKNFWIPHCYRWVLVHFHGPKSDETSKGISEEAISICHFSTICLSSYIYIVSLHSLSSVRGVEWCRTMGYTGRTEDRRSVRLYSNSAGVVRRGRPSCNGGPGYYHWIFCWVHLAAYKFWSIFVSIKWVV